MPSKSRRQVGFMLSSHSPLTPEQQARLKREMHEGKVKVKRGPRRKVRK